MLIRFDLSEIGCTAFIRAERDDGTLHVCCYDLLVVLGGYNGQIRRISDLCSQKKISGVFRSRCDRLGKLRAGSLWFASGEALEVLIDHLGESNFDSPHLVRAVIREVLDFPQELITCSRVPPEEVALYLSALETLRSSKGSLRLQAISRLQAEFGRLCLPKKDVEIVGRMFASHLQRDTYPEEEVYLYLLLSLRLSRETGLTKEKLLAILTECFSAISSTTKSFGG